MTEDDIRRVARSYGRVFPIRTRFARVFYDLLFSRHPQVRSLFPDDLAPQRAKFAGMLHQIIESLSDLAPLLEDIRALGERHRGYGAEPAHYDAVGEVLLDALKDTCPGGLTAEERASWAAAYRTLVCVMEPTYAAAA
ncbi:MAG: globin domain-containing protein [Shimia sp.]